MMSYSSMQSVGISEYSPSLGHQHNTLAIYGRHAKMEHVFSDGSCAVVENSPPRIHCTVLHARRFQQHYGLLLQLPVRSTCSFDGLHISRQPGHMACPPCAQSPFGVLSWHHFVGAAEC